METAFQWLVGADIVTLGLVYWTSPATAKYLVIFQLACAAGVASAIYSGYYVTDAIDNWCKRNPGGRDAARLGGWIWGMILGGIVGGSVGGLVGFTSTLYILTASVKN